MIRFSRVGGSLALPFPKHHLTWVRRNQEFVHWIPISRRPQGAAYISGPHKDSVEPIRLLGNCLSRTARSGTRKSSDANVLAGKQGFDFAPRSAGFPEVFRLPLRKLWVTTSRSGRYIVHSPPIPSVEVSPLVHTHKKSAKRCLIARDPRF